MTLSVRFSLGVRVLRLSGFSSNWAAYRAVVDLQGARLLAHLRFLPLRPRLQACLQTPCEEFTSHFQCPQAQQGIRTCQGCLSYSEGATSLTVPGSPAHFDHLTAVSVGLRPDHGKRVTLHLSFLLLLHQFVPGSGEESATVRSRALAASLLPEYPMRAVQAPNVGLKATQASLLSQS